ncbi:hypothetical protein Vi05172_g5206 [Venturia inaequalis]|nr:hypothetical protein Vi05172_g5206 [Venturia inaequalis]
MRAIWQSLKQRLSRRLPDRSSKIIHPKSTSDGSVMQSKETTTETDSTSVAAPHGEDQRDVHRPDAIPAYVDETQILQSGEQAVGAVLPRTSVSRETLSEEQQALIDDLRIDYEDVEDIDDDTVQEVVMEVEYTDEDSRVEIQPRLYESENTRYEPEFKSGLVHGHTADATPYKISFSIPAATSASPPDVTSVGVSNLEAGSDSAKRSYLSIIPTTIQAVTENTTLFVWHANFHPAIGRRFSSVIVTCKFSSPSTSRATQANITSSGAEIKAFAPHMSYGASSKEHRKIAWGLELPLTIPAGPVSVGVTPSGSREISKEVEHAFTIEGSARGTPLRTSCVWTVQENASTERGIPSELQLAALVKHSGMVQFDVDIEGTTEGGYLLNHHLRPKTGAKGRRKVIDPAKYAGLLQEFDFGGRGQAGCVKLLEKWTGQVQGAVLEFEQPVIRP